MKYMPFPKNKKILAYVMPLVVFASLFLFASQALALTLSPARLEISGNPGQTLSADLILINTEAQPQTYYSSYAAFEAEGETGAPKFVEGATDGLSTWMSAPSSVTLQGLETKKVQLVIRIPKDADPGGNFAAIFWSTQQPAGAGGSQVSIGAKLGTLVLLRVNGDVKEGGALLSYGTADNQSFFTSLPVSFTYRFQNSGNDRVKPAGTISINNILGIGAATINANDKDGNVLPQSIRKFTALWSKQQTDPSAPAVTGYWNNVVNEWHNFAFGRYSAHLDVTYGTANTRVTGTAVFWVIPWHLLLLILLGLLIVYFIFRAEIHAYTRGVIRSAMEYQRKMDEKNMSGARGNDQKKSSHHPKV